MCIANHILDISVIPANVSDEMEEEAEAIAVRLLTELEYCGVLAIEFFRMRDGRLIINEMAPRVHNSGSHYDGCRRDLSV